MVIVLKACVIGRGVIRYNNSGLIDTFLSFQFRSTMAPVAFLLCVYEPADVTEGSWTLKARRHTGVLTSSQWWQEIQHLNASRAQLCMIGVATLRGQVRLYSLENADAGWANLCPRRRRLRSVSTGGFLNDGIRQSLAAYVRYGSRG